MPKPAGATAPVPAPAKPAAAPKTAAAATAKETTVSKRKPAADKDASPAPKKAKAEAAPAAAAAAASSVPPAPPAPPAGVPPPPAPASGKKPSTAKDGSTKSHVNLTRVFADFKYRKAITVANPARLRIVKTKLQAIDASQVTDADQITQMLIADGVHELDKGDPKGYFWDDYYKDWKISIRWNGKRINFGHIKSSQALAAEAGQALVDKKKGLPKTADFKAIGKAIYATYKNKDVLAPKEQTAA